MLSNGTIWERLSVGFAGSAATSTTSGLVELATNAETQTGTDANTAVTPASLQSKLSDSTSTTSSNTIASSTAVKSAFDLATAAVPKSTVTTAGDLIYGTGAAAVARLGIGTVGQVLTVNAGATAPVWSQIPFAGPEIYGTVTGYTTGNSTFLGCCAGKSVTFASNTLIGSVAMGSGDGSSNTAIGAAALFAGSGNNNAIVGSYAFCALTTGCSNVALGSYAACGQTSGNSNVAIGPSVSLPTLTGSCQLALGFSATNNWLTGNSTKAIKPGAGIIDCANSCGSAGQALLSNGANALCWGNVVLPCTVTNYNTTSNCGFYGGNLLISQWEDGNILTPTALNPGPEGSMLCFNSTINGLAWCIPNFVRGNQFVKGSIAVGCAQVGGGIDTATFNGTGNNPGVAVGYYESIPLTGGTGSGATANFTVFIGGPVTLIEFVSISDPGSGYLVGDDLTVVINSVTIPYTLNVDTLATNTVNNYSFLSVGTNGQVLIADSTCTNGVKWGTAGAAGPATPTAFGGVLGRTDATNAAVGCNALLSLTTGAGNVAVGISSLRCLTTGVNNVAIGNSALCCNINGSGNVLVGTSAGMCLNSTDRVVGIGENALQCATSGAYNVAVGWGGLNALTTGACNTALGGAAGSFITTGNYNVAIGPNTQVAFGNQSCQLSIGWENCKWITGDCNQNTCVYNGFVIKGRNAPAPTGLTVTDTYFLPDGGYGPQLSMGNNFGHGKAFIAFRNPSNNIVGSIQANGTNNVVYLTSSDYRLKENVKDLEGATEVLRALPVREYNFIAEPEITRQGFLAHELQEFVPHAVSGTKDEVDEEGNPKHQGVDASQVVPLLVAALKESIARIDALEAEVKELKSNA